MTGGPLDYSGGDVPDFTVERFGTDTSGRPILMTRYMQAWWERVCAEVGFTPTIVQGAFMARVGGGAAASAGYHDAGGCLDLRVWDLTEEQVGRVVRTLRRLGAGAWLRDAQHGGMDPHIHFVLGSDQPIASGAQVQWSQYLNGRDGLASNGSDYHWRPSPLVTTPPEEDIMATLQELRDVVRDELAPIKSQLDGSRKREQQIRAKANEAARKADALLEAVKDDATKAQVRALRADIAALGEVDDSSDA